jgi:hypothetical protein
MHAPWAVDLYLIAVRFSLAGSLIRDPFLDSTFEEIKREASTIEHFVVESTNIEPRPQFFPGTLAEFQELELPYLVAASLCWPSDVAIRLRLNGGLIHCPDLRINSTTRSRVQPSE